MRRVVVTGLGMVSPLGGNVETSWKNIIASKSGAATITRFDATDYKCRIACEVKPADHEYGYDASLDVDHKIQRQVDPFIVFGISAASEALRDAGLDNMTEEERLRAGCSIGSEPGCCCRCWECCWVPPASGCHRSAVCRNFRSGSP